MFGYFDLILITRCSVLPVTLRLSFFSFHGIGSSLLDFPTQFGLPSALRHFPFNNNS